MNTCILFQICFILGVEFLRSVSPGGKEKRVGRKWSLVPRAVWASTPAAQERRDRTSSYFYRREKPGEEANFATVSCNLWTCKPLVFVVFRLKCFWHSDHERGSYEKHKNPFRVRCTKNIEMPNNFCYQYLCAPAIYILRRVFTLCGFRPLAQIGSWISQWSLLRAHNFIWQVGYPLMVWCFRIALMRCKSVLLWHLPPHSPLLSASFSTYAHKVRQVAEKQSKRKENQFQLDGLLCWWWHECSKP